MFRPANFQEKIFDLILSRYERKADAVDVVCEILNSSRDPVYRRFRGDTPLTPDEIGLLAKHFNISLDLLLFDQSNHVVCSFNGFAGRVTGFDDYLDNYLKDLGQIQRLPNARLWYGTTEIPVFSYMYFPELIAFKLFVWGKTTWNLPYLRNRSFEPALLTPPMLRSCQAILEHYHTLPTTELWCMGIADNTLAQIEYFVQTNGFQDPHQALHLCDTLLRWAEHLKAMAAVGKKFLPGSRPIEASAELQVFHNEMVNTNNTVLVTSDAGKAVFSAFSNPNYIKSTDPRLCDHTEEWFGQIITKSSPVSLAAEKSRDLFFQRLTKKIEHTKARIAHFLTENEAGID